MPRPADPVLESLWRRRLRQQPRSGLTIPQFCQREGVSAATFHSWKRRLALRATSATPFSSGGSTFVPVIVPPAVPSRSHGAADLVTFQLPNGGQILLPIAAGAELVCQVVETVARSSATSEAPSC
jgi:hypothetical protein